VTPILGSSASTAAAAGTFAALLVTAAVGTIVVRTGIRRFDHLACMFIVATAILQSTLALLGQALELDTRSVIIARCDTALWALGALAAGAFIFAFPLGRAPGPKARWVYAILGVMALVVPASAPAAALDLVVGSIAIVVGIAALHGGVLQVRRLSHPRGASARLIAAAAIVATWAFVGAAAILTEAVTRVSPTPPISMAARTAPLVAATMAGLAAAHYALVDGRRIVVSIAAWLGGGAIVVAAITGYRLLATWDGDGAVLGPAALVITMLVVVIGSLQRGQADAILNDRTSTTLSDTEPAAGPRQTLLALERLTDPLAVQERVVEALGELLPGAKLELLRARIAPQGVLSGAREVSTPLVLASVRRGWLAGHQIDELDHESRVAFAELGAALVIPVRCGPTVFGALLLDNLRIDRNVVMQARRFADLLGFKLETHRLYGELETHRRLASLGTLAAALAHDIRTPLSAIRMNVQMLQMRSDVLGPDAECLTIALEEVDRLNAQISTLLDFARPLPLEVGELDLASLATEALTRVSAIAAEAGVILRAELDPDLPRLPGDPARLSRVLVNLIENAVQASPAGSEVHVRAFSTAEVVEVVIRDRGRGIPAEELPRIFDPFFTTRTDGTGLGLAICRKIAQAHGGQILVSSEPGRGSEFRLRLPRHRTTPT
jgi:signal transduction histidine kinase